MLGSANPVKYVYANPNDYKQSASPGSKKLVIGLVVLLVLGIIIALIIGISIGRGKKDQKVEPSAVPTQPFLRVTAVDGKGRNEEITVLGNDKKFVYVNLKTGKKVEVAATDEQLKSIGQFLASPAFQSLNAQYGLGCDGCLTYIFVAGDGATNQKTVVTEWGIKAEPAPLAPFVKGFEDFVTTVVGQ